MNDITIKELGEYIPSVFNSVSMNKLKEFTIIPYFIDWYQFRKLKKSFSNIFSGNIRFKPHLIPDSRSAYKKSIF